MRDRLVPLSICAVALPCALLAVIGDGTAATGLDRPAGTPMALDGHLLVESAGTGTSAPRTVRQPSQVRSGDRLIFLIRYRNTGTKRLHGYDFVSAVPHGVEILPDRSDSLRVSADGGGHWSRPDSPLRNDRDGRLRPASELTPTHVRLRLDRSIAPGESGTVAYRGLLL